MAGTKQSEKEVLLECNRCLFDTQVFERGRDKVTFTGVYKYAGISLPTKDLPKFDKSGFALGFDVGENYKFSEFWQEKWDLKIKDAALKKKVQSLIDKGGSASDIEELGFENTDGWYDLKPKGDNNVEVIDSSLAESDEDTVAKLHLQGNELLQGETKENGREAVKLLQSALDLQAKIDADSDTFRFIGTDLGRAYRVSGDLSSALRQLEYVRTAYEKNEGRYGSGVTYLDELISEVFRDQGKYGKAIEFAEKSMLFDGGLEHMVSFAQLLDKASKHQDAIAVLRRADYATPIDDNSMLASIKLELFNVLIKKPDMLGEAQEILEEATTCAKLSEDKELIKACKEAKRKL